MPVKPMRPRFTISLYKAVICRRCGHVGEPLASERCSFCGDLSIDSLQLLLSPAANLSLHETTQLFQDRIVRTRLIAHRNNQCAVARELGIHRNTVRRILGKKSVAA